MAAKAVAGILKIKISLKNYSREKENSPLLKTQEKDFHYSIDPMWLTKKKKFLSIIQSV